MWQTPLAWDFILLVRSFYLISGGVILSARLSPSIQTRFLSYGPRNRPPVSRTPVSDSNANHAYFTKTLDRVARLQVPHRWFAHFYMLSTALTLVLLALLCSLENNFVHITPHRPGTISLRPPTGSSACMILMLVQGARRLYECLFVLKPSNSTMWIGHYVFGLAFYVATNMAIWLEAVAQPPLARRTSFETSLTAWPYQTQVGTLVFLTASVVQHTAHSELSRLRKYTLPDSRLFRSLVAPHYTAEVVIYLGMAIVGAPPASPFNLTFLCTALLAAVNLGITAEGTRQWMLEKFRDDRNKVMNRYCLVPGIW